MYKGKKIIVCSPVGRKRSLISLFNYIIKNRHIIDEYHLWLNTNNNDDLEFIYNFQSKHPDFVHLKYGCDKLDQNQIGKAHNVKRFYNYCVENNTVYFKIDDDIIYIEDGTFESMIDYKIDNPSIFLTFPTILNNYWCTEFLRRNNILNIPKCEICSYLWYIAFDNAKNKIASDPDTLTKDAYQIKMNDYIPEDRFFSNIYWRDPTFAKILLEKLQNVIQSSKLQLLDIPNMVLINYEPISIQFIMWFGEDFAKFNGNVRSVDDEPWLTMFYPLKQNLFNGIIGNKRVVHYAYWPQRAFLDQTNILEEYHKMSME